MLTRVFILATLFLLVGSVIADDTHHPAADYDPEKFGKVHFPVSCTPTAQAQFDQAIATLHSFWHSEAEKTFRQVTVTDPDCAMGYWGIAMSLYQQLWVTTPTRAELQRGRAAIAQAQSMAIRTAREQAYLDAAAALYPANDNNDYSTRKLAYQQAMERVYKQYPDNEATVFYALESSASASPDDKHFTK